MIPGFNLLPTAPIVRDGNPIFFIIENTSGIVLGANTFTVSRNAAASSVTFSQMDANRLKAELLPAEDELDHEFIVRMDGNVLGQFSVGRAPKLKLVPSSVLNVAEGPYVDGPDVESTIGVSDLVWLATSAPLLDSEVVKVDVIYTDNGDEFSDFPYVTQSMMPDRTLRVSLGNISDAAGGVFLNLKVNGASQPEQLLVQVSGSVAGGIKVACDRGGDVISPPQLGVDVMVPEFLSVIDSDLAESDYGKWRVSLRNVTLERNSIRVYGFVDDLVTNGNSDNGAGLQPWESYRLKHRPGSAPPSEIKIYENLGLVSYTLCSLDGVTPPTTVDVNESTVVDMDAIGTRLLDSNPNVTYEDRWVEFLLEPGAHILLDLSVSVNAAKMHGTWKHRIETRGEFTEDIRGASYIHTYRAPNTEASSMIAMYNAASPRTGISSFGNVATSTGLWEIKDSDGNYLITFVPSSNAMESPDYDIGVVVYPEYESFEVFLDRNYPEKTIILSAEYAPGLASLLQLYMYTMTSSMGVNATKLRSKLTIQRDGLPDQVVGIAGPGTNARLKIDAPTKVVVEVSIVPGSTGGLDVDYSARVTFGLQQYQ